MIYFITIGLVVLLALGVPVAFSLGIAALFGYMQNAGGNMVMSVISRRMMFGLNNFLLLSIPLFILSAKIMNSSKITSKNIRLCPLRRRFSPRGSGARECRCQSDLFRNVRSRGSRCSRTGTD